MHVFANIIHLLVTAQNTVNMSVLKYLGHIMLACPHYLIYRCFILMK